MIKTYFTSVHKSLNSDPDLRVVRCRQGIQRTMRNGSETLKGPRTRLIVGTITDKTEDAFPQDSYINIGYNGKARNTN